MKEQKGGFPKDPLVFIPKSRPIGFSVSEEVVNVLQGMRGVIADKDLKREIK